MPARIRQLVALACAFLLLTGAAATASADNYEEPTTDKSVPVLLDVLIMRPLGFLTLVAGVVLLAPATAITLITRPHEIGKPLNLLVVEPAKYIWVDPFGTH